ncbi:hypothetical protein QWY75_01695 [Pontixanthobacter aestiaquae]|uniref:Uncharacterized protein n=1 Tax=Pontixanthobacter aestiaquae TaxID=1509367 RepID=A0A844Z846_9SPHN|nr:hypothetical protein [Pontixanthobacter aestiaquae]MDN3644914.1 hypothetical protein [Pontixanthobacter aestiaquae]MXO84085.1 hypothetical protein [Pontixanthobacter aestiaquae]
MRKFQSAALVAASLAVANCGPGVPIELPEDTIAAAQTCFAAKGLVLRDGKSQGDDVTYDEFVGAIKYPMIAASQVEPFDMNAIITILNGVEAIADDVATKDYEGAVTTCDKRFAAAPLSLPEDDDDAIISCTAMAGFLSGVVEGEGEAFGGDKASVNALMTRLESEMETSPELLVTLATGNVEEMMNSALKDSFAQGDVDGYVTQCQKRFPAKSES